MKQSNEYNRMDSRSYAVFQLTSLVALRVLIGWHFLYEGVAKALNPYWSSAGYLNEAKGFLSGVYGWIVLDPTRIQVVDACNTYGLIAVGLGLMLGLFTRTATGAAGVLLILYYFVTPPYAGLSYQIPFEGS